MRLCVAHCSRADHSPLIPVIKELRRFFDVDELRLPRLDYRDGYWNAALETVRYLDTAEIKAIVLLGDRYETLACAGAAVMFNIPIVHLHGGEITLGSFDDSYRNAISQLASYHFVSAKPYAKRLEKMGIDKTRIVVAGVPGLDHEIDPEYVPPFDKYFVVTYHPATRAEENSGELINALEKFPDYGIIFTGTNNDPGNVAITARISAWADGNKRVAVCNMPPSDYLMACVHAKAVIGNSSSGLLEIPTLKTPTVDVGDRQKGRLRAPSVFHAECKTDSIVEAINEALKYRGPWHNPHKGPGASKKIAKTLEKWL